MGHENNCRQPIGCARNRSCGICGSDLRQLFVDAGLDEATASEVIYDTWLSWPKMRIRSRISLKGGEPVRSVTQSKAMPLTQCSLA